MLNTKFAAKLIAVSLTLVLALSAYSAAAYGEIYSFFQPGRDYQPSMQLPTDAVAPYIFSSKAAYEDYVANYPASAYDKMAMVSFTHDFDNRYVDGYFDGISHPEVVQKMSDGTLKTHMGVHSYVTPTAGWNNYVKAQAVKAINKGATVLILEEPELFGDAGYDDAFKAEWLSYYGSAWTDPAGSESAFIKASKLRNYLLQREINDVLGYLKTNYPSVKTYIATHSVLSYSNFKNPFGNAEGYANSLIDGFVGQAWSNTMESGVYYEGSVQSLPFENGYLDYSYFAQLGKANPTKKTFTIMDPKGDGYAGKTEAWLNDMFAKQLTATLVNDNLSRFELPIWPDRIMGLDENEMSDGFKTQMSNAITLLNDAHNHTTVTTSNKPVKVGVLISDTANWQAGGPGNTANHDSVNSLVMPLLHRGLLVDGVPLEAITASANILNAYDVIYLSYDIMKPQSSAFNEKIRDWINAGGIAVYFGGRTPYENTAGQWWNSGGSAYASPQDHLMSLLGAGLSGRTTAVTASSLTAESGSTLAAAISTLPSTSGYSMIGYASGSVTPMYKSGSTIVAFEKNYGTGRFVYFGIDPYYFGGSATGSSKMFNIIQNIASVYKSVTVNTQNSIQFTRAPYKGIYAINGTTAASGKFIDMMDPDLPVITNKQVAQGSASLLLDVSGTTITTIPRVLFAQGNKQTTISESAANTQVFAKGSNNTLGAVRILAKSGLVPALATAVDGAGKNQLYSQEWDDVSKSLLVKYWNHGGGVTVNIGWGASGSPAKMITKVADDRDGAVTYSGSWNNWNSDLNDYGSTEKFVNTSGSYAEYSFTGHSVRWFGPTGTNMGKADVYIDGVLQAANVDQYAAVKTHRQVLFSKTGLADSAHTIKVVVKGTKHASSSDSNVVIDKFEAATGTLTAVDDRGGAVTYSSGWNQWNGDASDYAATETFSYNTGSYVQFAFSGTTINVIGKFGSNQGRASIYVDGVLVRSGIELYAAANAYQQSIYSNANLAAGAHTIKVEVDGTKHASSSSYNVVIDKFEYK